MSKIPNEKQILERIVKNLQKDKAHVMRKGKSIIPQSIDDLPPNMRISSHREHRRAYSNLYCVMNYKPIATPVVAKRKSKMKVKTPTKVAPTPLMLAETPKASPMQGYKQVARTGRVNEDTFTNLVKEYSQEFKIDSMSLTNLGTLVVKWKEVKS